jgi:hypothetical protein
MGRSLLSCYLATVGGYIDPQTQAFNNSSIVACIHCHGNILTILNGKIISMHKNHITKTCRGGEINSHGFLISEVDGGA